MNTVDARTELMNQAFKTAGFEHMDTGGGCTAWVRDAQPGIVMVTEWSGTEQPKWGENFIVGTYPTDYLDEHTAMHEVNFTGSGYTVKEDKSQLPVPVCIDVFLIVLSDLLKSEPA